MTALTVTAAKVSANQNQGAVIRPYRAGGTVSLGQAVYLDSNGYVQAADANTAAVTTARAVGIVVATSDPYGSTSAAANESVSVCLSGIVYGFSGLTPGAYGWVSKTAGEIEDTAPTGGAYQYILGQAMSATEFYVNPGIYQPASV